MDCKASRVSIVGPKATMDTIVSGPICISAVKISIWRLKKLNEPKPILSLKNWSDNENGVGPWSVRKEEAAAVVIVEQIERACLRKGVDVEMEMEEEEIRDDKVAAAAAILGDKVVAVVVVVEIHADKVVVAAVVEIHADKVVVVVEIHADKVVAAVFANGKKAGGTNRDDRLHSVGSVAKIFVCD
jgi:hypothetical protein